ncbi:hypothetical protein PGT21_001849 [Puccinia graminis f. sp. tritici]|uniref:Uncharacterized protein n=2 Tax=Puccinia graminis f. sp. tritici TaxID=56615 RepID=E3JY66_PUCGT|nr:uncharacterized protein PGTG_02452 [Puccinia graminis f. sp. tritici CRL 75-36-700-3]EFP76991.1 hypothetical protein PGTG_02452 [Puccinia graminis f. sp. tritici CRL 75-36-700-3]KAA1118675.1 hypothetical protein PGT21_001849 [Puccinia graminis f. sp. tritici]
MTFNTEWIPGATFSGSAFSDFVNASPAPDPLPSNDLDAARLNDDDSTASSGDSSVSDDETNLANDAEADNANAEVADLNTSNPVVLASDESPPAYQLAALPLGSPENPIEIDDDGTNNDEALLSPRFDAVEIVPFRATVVDEEDVLRARERITRWFNNHIRHNSQRVLRGRSRRARTAAGPVESFWTTSELMESVLEELDDVLNNASRVELIHV